MLILWGGTRISDSRCELVPEKSADAIRLSVVWDSTASETDAIESRLRIWSKSRSLTGECAGMGLREMEEARECTELAECADCGVGLEGGRELDLDEATLVSMGGGSGGIGDGGRDFSL